MDVADVAFVAVAARGWRSGINVLYQSASAVGSILARCRAGQRISLTGGLIVRAEAGQRLGQRRLHNHARHITQAVVIYSRSHMLRLVGRELPNVPWHFSDAF